jgi:hypothetical protein
MPNLITINRDGVAVDEEFLAVVLARTVRHLSNEGSEAVIFTNDREPSGWLEYTLCLKYANGGGMTIGCIQRTIGGAVEFHS